MAYVSATRELPPVARVTIELSAVEAEHLAHNLQNLVDKCGYEEASDGLLAKLKGLGIKPTQHMKLWK